MIKTNSKQARENIKTYIMQNFYCDGYGIKEPETFEGVATVILDIFREEYRHEYEKRIHTEQQSFREWSAGLPSILDTCYFYNRSAVDDLAGILEETDEEKAKYSESDAENLLTYLIYRELIKAEEKANRR